MKRYFLTVPFASLAFAAPLLAASIAYADATCETDRGTVVTISDTSSCHFETSGGCTSQCTPVNFTATCGTECTKTATESCTNECKTTCETECTKQPDTFSCETYCNTDCEAGCMAECDGDSCAASCQAKCSTECTKECQVHPGATECTTKCSDCCKASCTVQENISCEVDCVSDLQGGCETKCEEANGGLFCDGQFISISDVADCSFEIKGSVNVDGDVDISTSCSAAPGNSPFNVGAGLAAIAGLGLLVARRRRNA